MNPEAKASIFDGFKKVANAATQAIKSLATKATEYKDPLGPPPTNEAPGKYIAYALDGMGRLSRGRAAYAGQRQSPPWNKFRLSVNSRALELFRKGLKVLTVFRRVTGEEVTAKDLYLLSTKSAEMAVKSVIGTRRAKRRKRNKQARLSRRINGNRRGRTATWGKR